MVPFELLLVSAFVVTSSAIPTNKPLDHYRGVSAAQYHLTAGFQRSSNKYQCLEGGATAYPPTSTWLPFDALWNINQPIVLSSNGGDTYIEHYVHEAIIEASKKRKHDERLILAVVMQVSNGKVTAPCFGPSQVKCDKTFDPSRPKASLMQMIDEGLHMVARMDCWTTFSDRFAPHPECPVEGYLSDLSNRLLGWDGSGEGFESCHE